MIHSMTGFGKADGILANKKISIQVKSLNSKQSDISTKIPSLFKELELDFRKALADQLIRGKIELSINYENLENSSNFELDKDLLVHYVKELKSVQADLGLADADLIATASRFPEILKNQTESINEEDKSALLSLLNEAIANTQQFRADEGKSLSDDLSSHVNAIAELLKEALQYESERAQTVKDRLLSNLEDLELNGNFNQDRFEQELIYYLEKYDISEEKVRLSTHCDYFMEMLEGPIAQGKKLGFISQEMGREINTLGSKANHAEMQKLVVQMKDELEKIKEQILNVL